jgi:hypothetical protein
MSYYKFINGNGVDQDEDYYDWFGYRKECISYCSAKVVMSAFSQVKMSSFVGVDLDEGVNQFEP